MMRDATLDQTLQEKTSFERELAKYDVQVIAYRADNRRFADLMFEEEVRKCNQVVSHCGVCAHDGMFERYIGKITVR